MMGSNEKRTGESGSLSQQPRSIGFQNAGSQQNSTPIPKGELSFLTKALLLIVFLLLVAIPMKFVFEGYTERQVDVPISKKTTQTDLPTEKEFNQMIVDIQSGDPVKVASVIDGVVPQFMMHTLAEKITGVQLKIDAATVERDPVQNDRATVRASVTTADGKMQKGLLYLAVKDGRWVIVDILPDKN